MIDDRQLYNAGDCHRHMRKGDCIDCLREDRDGLEISLTQARAELEEAKRWRATHEVCHDKWDGLQAKLAAMRAKLADKCDLHVGGCCLNATLQQERSEKAESQAAELRRALEEIAYKSVPQDRNATIAKIALSNLPASAQDRAEREAARDAVVEVAKMAEPIIASLVSGASGGAQRIHAQLWDAIARLAALDSAQKGERR